MTGASYYEDQARYYTTRRSQSVSASFIIPGVFFLVSLIGYCAKKVFFLKMYVKGPPIRRWATYTQCKTLINLASRRQRKILTIFLNRATGFLFSFMFWYFVLGAIHLTIGNSISQVFIRIVSLIFRRRVQNDLVLCNLGRYECLKWHFVSVYCARSCYPVLDRWSICAHVLHRFVILRATCISRRSLPG